MTSSDSSGVDISLSENDSSSDQGDTATEQSESEEIQQSEQSSKDESPPRPTKKVTKPQLVRLVGTKKSLTVYRGMFKINNQLAKAALNAEGRSVINYVSNKKEVIETVNYYLDFSKDGKPSTAKVTAGDAASPLAKKFSSCALGLALEAFMKKINQDFDKKYKICRMIIGRPVEKGKAGSPKSLSTYFLVIEPPSRIKFQITETVDKKSKTVGKAEITDLHGGDVFVADEKDKIAYSLAREDYVLVTLHIN
jgi:hypothetical protein